MKTPKKAPAKFIRKGLGFKPDDEARLQRLRKYLEPEMGDLKDMTIVRLALISYEIKQEAISKLAGMKKPSR